MVCLIASSQHQIVLFSSYSKMVLLSPPTPFLSSHPIITCPFLFLSSPSHRNFLFGVQKMRTTPSTPAPRWTPARWTRTRELTVKDVDSTSAFELAWCCQVRGKRRRRRRRKSRSRSFILFLFHTGTFGIEIRCWRISKSVVLPAVVFYANSTWFILSTRTLKQHSLPGVMHPSDMKEYIWT